MTRQTRAAPGARSAPPESQANPEPLVGSKPNDVPKPKEPEGPELEFVKPPSMRVEEPAPGTEMIEVETTGDFMIVDTTNLYEIPHDKAVSVPKTSFIENAIEDGRLKEA